MPVGDAAGQSVARPTKAALTTVAPSSTSNNNQKPKMSAEISFSCSKWADCSCNPCNCGETCSCGTVSVSDMTDLMGKSCGFSDCMCGATCGCGKACKCGSTNRTKEEWITYAKEKKGSS